MLPEPDTDSTEHFYTRLSVGEILRRARLKKGLSIEQVEVAVRISASHLIAIEEGRLEVLPGRVYAIGFVKTYAEYVGLNGDKVLGLLKRQAGEKISPKHIERRDSSTLEDHSLPSVKVFFIVTLCFVMLILGRNYFRFDYSNVNESIPSVPQDLKDQMTTLSMQKGKVALPEQPDDYFDFQNDSVLDDMLETAVDDTGSEPVLEGAPANQIVLKAIDNVWLEIRDKDHKTIFSRVLSIGEEYWIPADQTGLTMTAGNAGGLQIIIGGQVLPPVGKSGQVVRNVALDLEKFKENLKNSAKPSM
jgi:cytoskeleton protein RodZ